jgi:putative glutamine amidotransferase
MNKPVIGISSAGVFDSKYYSQRVTYPKAVETAGGVPVFLPCGENLENIPQIISGLDGLLVPGGADVDPALYSEERHPRCGISCAQDDAYDMALIREAVKQKKPILAICRGMQLVNVVFGGTLYQDIPCQYGGKLYHSMLRGGVENYHMATFDPNSKIGKIIGGEAKINSSHHQAVKDVAKGFKIVGKAPDGINEAMEDESGQILCVQWHPERQQNTAHGKALFLNLIERSKK